MQNLVNRRTFIASTAAAGALAGWSGSGLAASFLHAAPINTTPAQFATKIAEKAPWELQPFPMKHVRLRNGLFKTAVEANSRYLRFIPNDRLPHISRQVLSMRSVAPGKDSLSCCAGETSADFTERREGT